MSAAAALLLSLASGAVMADVTLPAVIVKGTTIDGSNVACYGYACADFLSSIGGVEPGFRTPKMAMGEGGGGDLSITKEQFCNQLASQRPSGCNAASPPSVPTYDPMWEPNGCGTGAMANFLLERVMGGLYSDHFSGNLDTPVDVASGPDISFFVACNHHDQCWGSAQSRGGCDRTFFTEMTGQCDGLAGADYDACYGIAATFYSGVASDFATEHYDASVDDFACAAWAYDMRRNGCI